MRKSGPGASPFERLICVLLGAWALSYPTLGCRPVGEPSGPASVFFLVRHAEKLDESRDPPLTDLGNERARTLARMLADTQIDAIWSSDFLRTRNTGGPLSEATGVGIELYDTNDLPSLADTLLSSTGRHLVVGHSNTTPQLVRLLGGEPGADIADDEYDRLYVLVHRPGMGTTTALMRFAPVQRPPLPHAEGE